MKSHQQLETKQKIEMYKFLIVVEIQSMYVNVEMNYK
jgi:hypothetical protein